jgi:hypothetical protein
MTCIENVIIIYYSLKVNFTLDQNYCGLSAVYQLFQKRVTVLHWVHALAIYECKKANDSVRDVLYNILIEPGVTISPVRQKEAEYL